MNPKSESIGQSVSSPSDTTGETTITLDGQVVPFTEGESLKFTGVPNFAPELFRRVVLRDPLRMKALHKGLDQLSEEGASQVFRPLAGNDVILGAAGDDTLMARRAGGSGHQSKQKNHAVPHRTDS